MGKLLVDAVSWQGKIMTKEYSTLHANNYESLGADRFADLVSTAVHSRFMKLTAI